MDKQSSTTDNSKLEIKDNPRESKSTPIDYKKLCKYLLMVPEEKVRKTFENTP